MCVSRIGTGDVGSGSGNGGGQTSVILHTNNNLSPTHNHSKIHNSQTNGNFDK